MVSLHENLKKEGRALVIAQHDWRQQFGNDMSAAADDTPEHRAFNAALAEFKTALFAANPELGTQEGFVANGVAHPVIDRGGAVFKAMGSTSSGGYRNGSTQHMDTESARTVHRFLRELAVEEYGAAYATQAPRPFDDALEVTRR